MSFLLVSLIVRSVVAPPAPPPCAPPPKVRVVVPCEPGEGCSERWVWVEPGVPIS